MEVLVAGCASSTRRRRVIVVSADIQRIHRSSWSPTAGAVALPGQTGRPARRCWRRWSPRSRRCRDEDLTEFETRRAHRAVQHRPAPGRRVAVRAHGQARASSICRASGSCPIEELQDPPARAWSPGDLATVHQFFRGPVAGDAVLLLEYEKAAHARRPADRRRRRAGRQARPVRARSPRARSATSCSARASAPSATCCRWRSRSRCHASTSSRSTACCARVVIDRDQGIPLRADRGHAVPPEPSWRSAAT